MIIRHKLTLLVLCINWIVLSCTQKPKLETRKIDNYSITAAFTSGGQIDGVARYFDSLGILKSIITYNRGMRSGKAINYYINGKMKDSLSYAGNRENGYWFHHDSAGKLNFVDFYYYGLPVGPQTVYKKERFSQFYFTDFHRVDLVAIDFDSLGPVSQIKLFRMNLTLTEKLLDTVKVVNLFAYLPTIPNTNSRFAIGLTNDSNATHELAVIRNDQVFIDTILPVAKLGWNYYISCHVQNGSGSLNKLYIEKGGD